jgi:hypothetical protein
VQDGSARREVVTDGKYAAADENKRPILWGVLEVEAKSGKAAFTPLRIEWRNAVELVLRATCYTPHQHWVSMLQVQY